jgi:hypothetical protein
LTGVYEFCRSGQAVDPSKRAALARTIDAYANEFPGEVGWATSAQAPSLLQ